MADLEAGLDHSMMTGQLGIAAVCFHDKMMSSSEEGQQVDRARIVKELSYISKFMGGSNRGGGGSSAYQQPPMPPANLSQHFGGHRRQSGWNGPGAPGHYAPRPRSKQAKCSKCKNSGRTGADILHSYKQCPLVVCHTCKRAGHIEKYCSG
ncbi:unnamed protein product [Pylaiella littoralis]